jgi:hypothetical protein
MNSGVFFTLHLWQLSILLIAIATSCEFLLKSNLPILLKEVFILLNKTIKLLKSTYISDERKEVLILLYSRKLLSYSAVFLLKIILVFLPIAAVLWAIFNHWWQVLNFILQLDVIIIITLTSFVYIFFRVKFK